MTRSVGGGGGGGCCGLAIVFFYLCLCASLSAATWTRVAARVPLRLAVRGDLDPCGGEGAQHFAQRLTEAQLLPQCQSLEN